MSSSSCSSTLLFTNFCSVSKITSISDLCFRMRTGVRLLIGLKRGGRLLTIVSHIVYILGKTAMGL